MRRRQIALLLALAVGCSMATSGDDEYRSAFEAFMKKYDRRYASLDEERFHFSVFKANYQYIKEQNSKQQSFVLEVNEFADQSPHEFKSTRFGLSKPAPGKLWKGLPHLGTDSYSGASLPSAVDWSAKGAVTPPKNQQQCGSCWAFSTTGALEGAWQVATGKLVSLSEQQLVDCSKDNNGCGGGDMDMAFSFLKDHGSCTEDSYDYTAKNGKCVESKCDVAIPKGAVTGYFDVPADDEKALMEAVAQQPVSVAIEADQMAFQLYQKGILTKTCGNKLDHGVLLVGYGTENGTDYWKVKNSWGATWGEHGYIRLERGLPKEGECGIKSQASYPKVHAGPSPPSPAPAPGPAPTCKDAESFCEDDSIFNAKDDCELLFSSCKKTCGCCSSSAPAYCSGSAKTGTIVV